MKVLYFTATGNSLYVAKSLGGEILSIPQMIKQGIYEFSDERIGIVFPLHGWAVPPYVVDFLKKAKFNTNYLFAITTYGIYSGAVATHLKSVAKESNLNFSYINKIQMVDNYIPTFDMEKEIKKEPKKEIEKNISILKKDIEESKNWILKESFLSKKSASYMFNRKGKPFNKKRLKVHVYGEGIDNYLKVDDSCIQCGVCASVCPVSNISLDPSTGKIKLSDKCFMCFACVHSCPKQAIHINGEVNSYRYRNKNIKLNEIVKANKQ